MHHTTYRRFKRYNITMRKIHIITLDDGDTDPIHIYWDQKKKSFSTWSL